MSGLRVIAGKARGRKLRSVPGESTRPITDRTKEALFNIIGGDIHNASLLDLFAGTGSVGIEALSRGAIFVRFIDNHKQAIKTIWDNLQLTKLPDSKQGQAGEVWQMDAFRLLDRAPDRDFDYIYIAPPQYKQLWSQCLIALDRNVNWIAKAGWVITQIHPIEYQQLELHNLVEFDQRRYGSTLLVFYHANEQL